ncbi:Peptidase C78 ubiquitin fold modifier-specific peptidase 1 2 protein [Rutstroemia sp. NJR-2017a BBW]|nr:Peptidase C78 ubiquitin fold modifier-specific peptidase 1 2 protein [Rutstroemia sp. NJR-2017a BBW]
MASTRFSRLFDDWDRDHQDISMLEHSSPRYSSQDRDTEYRSPNDSPNNSNSSRNSPSRRNSEDISQRPSPLPAESRSVSFYDDGTSTRRLLNDRASFASSFGVASTNDYQALKNGTDSVEGKEPRLRNGLGGNVKRMWTKGTAFTKRTSSTFDGNFAHGKDGWWKKQMLVDRSLRTMAGLTFLSAMIMFIIIIVYLPAFSHRLNKSSTSVVWKAGILCDALTHINNYRHYGNYYYGSADDFSCWTAFRAGIYVFPKNISQLAYDYNADVLGNSTSFSSVDIQYSSNCTGLRQTATVEQATKEINFTYYSYYGQYQNGNCALGVDIYCNLLDQQPKKCRLNVRMQAAFSTSLRFFYYKWWTVLMNVSIIRLSDHQSCVHDSTELEGTPPYQNVLPDIHNECLLNSGDGYRHKTIHTCHKHCTDPIPSTTGDETGHCQKCKKFNDVDKAADLPHPNIAIKYKRSLLSNLGSTAVTQMIILMFCSIAMLGVSIMLITLMASTSSQYKYDCSRHDTDRNYGIDCTISLSQTLKNAYGTWGGNATLSPLAPDSISSELLAFAISNGAQFLFSLLYLLLIYNITLVSMENEWGNYELKRRKPRATIVSGAPFEQSYFLQLPSKILMPLMIFAAAMHWLLGESISVAESIFTDPQYGVEHSVYAVTFAAYPIFISTVLMVGQTVICWWAFTYRREGFIPQMYGSIRACCASTSELTDFGRDGIQWGDLGMGTKFRHAGFSSDDLYTNYHTSEPGKIIPAELYCGRD